MGSQLVSIFQVNCYELLVSMLNYQNKKNNNLKNAASASKYVVTSTFGLKYVCEVKTIGIVTAVKLTNSVINAHFISSYDTYIVPV